MRRWLAKQDQLLGRTTTIKSSMTPRREFWYKNKTQDFILKLIKKPQLWIKSVFYSYSFCCVLPLTICVLCFFVFIFWILRLHLFVVVRPRSWSCMFVVVADQPTRPRASQRLTHVQRSMRGGVNWHQNSPPRHSAREWGASGVKRARIKPNDNKRVAISSCNNLITAQIL